MLEKNLRERYQKICIDPLLNLKIFERTPPIFFTCMACLIGIGIFPLIVYQHRLFAFCLLCVSGFLDTFDGSLARRYGKTSSYGAALDIVSDRIVEFAVLLGLLLVDPTSRALPAFLMLGSILICVTSFLVVGIFTENQSSKSFHYSAGLMERAEAFVFFATMILLPASFFVLSLVFSVLVFWTAVVRMIQFFKNCD